MSWLLSLISGVVLALGFAALARLVRLDQKRLFAPVLLVVVAVFYVGFALANGSSLIIIQELTAAFLFLILALVGGAFYIPIAIFGLLLHGVFDVFHNNFVSNPDVPTWWPAFCAGFDVTVAFWVWWLWRRGKARIVPPGEEP
ncbi:DUF6010 family protein [Marinimicrobium agarilyticum]|uniref:DUF6010 family protein n=1 Tax=Marinimicrobium agarilyticum TaxID=306546 RepID=UPI0004048049|nr:DUF6010 family protein [Marinimicrobium agarilyticum]